MQSWWKKLKNRQRSVAPTKSILPPQPPADLVFFADNYLEVFAIESDGEKARHAKLLMHSASEVASFSGYQNLHDLLISDDADAIVSAIRFSSQKCEPLVSGQGGHYWLASFAVVHLLILSTAGLIENGSNAALVAEKGALLYDAYSHLEAARAGDIF